MVGVDEKIMVEGGGKVRQGAASETRTASPFESQYVTRTHLSTHLCSLRGISRFAFLCKALGFNNRTA